MFSITACKCASGCQSLEYDNVTLLQHCKMELLMQIDSNILSKLFYDGDWSDPEGQREEKDNSDNKIQNVEDPDQTVTQRHIVYIVHQPVQVACLC